MISFHYIDETMKHYVLYIHFIKIVKTILLFYFILLYNYKEFYSHQNLSYGKNQDGTCC
jgi:hypothetical protein